MSTDILIFEFNDTKIRFIKLFDSEISLRNQNRFLPINNNQTKIKSILNVFKLITLE